jgi:hypothetical protein
VNIIRRLIGGLGNTVPSEDITKIISGSGDVNLDNIKYYIDIVDFHTYAGGNGGDLSGVNSGNFTTYRNALMNYPEGGFANELSTNTDRLQKLINDANTLHSRSGGDALTFAITEMNICWRNPPLTSPSSRSIYENTFEGIGCRSFFAGQYWAEMFSSILKNGGGEGQFVMPWSIHESGGDGDSTDLGMTKGTASSSVTPTPLSTYHHYNLLADNFKCITNYQAGVTNTALKVFGGYTSSSKYTVVILNETSISPSDPGPIACTLRLDASQIGTNWIKMAYPSGPSTQLNLSIDASSTVVLVFDGSGTLSKKVEYKQSAGSGGTPVTTTYTSGVVSTDLGADISLSPCCSTTLTSNPSISGATYSWFSSSSNYQTSVYSSTTTNTYGGAGAGAIYKVRVTKNGCSAEDYIKINEGFSSCCSGPDPGRLIGDTNTLKNNTSILLDNIPNPNDGKTTITFTLADEVSKGEIIIMDLFGKKVETIPFTRGSSSVEFICTSCPNGIYFYSLFADDVFISTKKMVISK